MIIRTRKICARLLLFLIIAAMAATSYSTPLLAQNNEEKPSLHYLTNNGVIFYENGFVHCGDGTVVTGGAAGALQKQKGLDPQWIPVIISAASKAGADPLAMASLLFWENRGFPKYGDPGGGSDSVGRGPWQITRATWPSGAGDYHTNVVDPVVSTGVAAKLVKSWGGQAGIPIGSIDQDFSKNSNIPSMATVAKNYNAGRYTWREPGVAGFKQAGRVWKDARGPWFDQKQTIIDEYIIAMTYAYYQIATGQSLPAKGALNNDNFVKEGLANADKIKSFKVTDGSNTGEVGECSGAIGEGNGDIVETAKALAWPNRRYDNIDRKSAARQSYQQVMPKVQGNSTANSYFEGKTAWSDCGVFVATVMRHSGADPSYALRGTGVQLSYARKHPEKFEVRRFENSSQLQPGDVFIISDSTAGHTFIHTGNYTGDDKKKYDGYSASWGSRTPMANRTLPSVDGYNYFFARLKTNSEGQ